MDVSGFLGKNPYVRVVIPFVLGIISCYCWHVPLFIGIATLALFLPAAIIVHNTCHKYTTRWVCGIFIFCCFYSLGIILTAFCPKSELPQLPDECEYRACVVNSPNRGNMAYKVDLQVEAVKLFGTWHGFDVMLSGTIAIDSVSDKLKAGQTIVFNAKIDTLDAPKNPFGFDYSQYLKMNGVQGSIYLNQGDWHIDKDCVHGIKQHALNLRQRLVRILEETGLSGNELGLASTLVLGYKNDIDAEVKEAYMNAGAMHVLAVSGMHVGIVCTALEILMKLLGGCRLLRMKRFVIIALLWCYAFLTGLSPSVIRATVMFTFVMLGKIVNRNINVYNSLAASALTQLAYNPTMLFNAGFQLSYVAVIGIVFFQPRIVALVKIPKQHIITSKLWELTAVSFAAQISTFPFCLYYFERTPVYFWLSNLVVSPGATVMIFVTLLLLAVSSIGCIAKIVGMLTAYIAKSMNFLVMSIANLPFSTIENSYISVFQSIAIAAIIIGISAWIVTKKYNWMLCSLATLLMFVSQSSLNKIKSSRDQAICVYYSPKNPLVQFVDGNHSLWFNDLNFGKKINPLVKGGNAFWNATKYTSISQSSHQTDNHALTHKGFFVFNRKKGFMLNDSSELFYAKKPMTIDYLIITGDPQIKVKQMPQELTFKNIIIDASVKPWIAKEWERKYKTCQIHDVRTQGAYIGYLTKNE